MTCRNWWNHEFCTLQKILKEIVQRISFVTSSSSALGLCSWTMIPNTPAISNAHAWKPSCGWIKTILQRREGQNSSTAMWRTRCQLSHMLDCSCCCEVWHNQLLDLGANYFFHIEPGRLEQLFSLNRWNHYFKTAFCIYSGYFSVILKLFL